MARPVRLAGVPAGWRALILCGLLAALRAAPGWADDSFAIRIDPWPAGARAAVSVTFDDGYPSQVEVAAPLLEARGFRGTFYLIVDKLFQRGKYRDLPSAGLEQWQAAARRGHEIGSHSWSHVDLDSLDAGQLQEELGAAQEALEALFPSALVTSLAYPFSRAGPAVRRRAGDFYLTGRLGPAAIGSPVYNDPGTGDLLALNAFFLCTGQIPDFWNQTVDQALAGNGWLVEGLHPVDEEGYCEVAAADLAAHLDYLAALGERVWVAPVGQVAGRLRAWRQTRVLAARRSAEELELQLDQPSGNEYAWQAAISVGGPSDWELADDQGYSLPLRLEADHLSFTWPAAQRRLLLVNRQASLVSSITWGQVKANLYPTSARTP